MTNNIGLNFDSYAPTVLNFDNTMGSVLENA
jgi:hypothetical protein